MTDKAESSLNAGMSKKALLRACEIAGSQQGLADLIGLRSQGTIQDWISRGRPPAERVLAIEAATGISRHELRPDLYPADSKPKRARA